MQKVKRFQCIGAMSGTSLDGLDLAYCKFIKLNDGWDWNINACETISYSEYWINKLSNARNLSVSQLDDLNVEYGKYLAEEITSFIERNHLHVDFVASHGHTVFHQPENNYTLQIGDGVVMAEHLNTHVINNFRIKDVQLKGQGAPLVPIGDKLLFSEFDCCVNLGGFINISMDIDGERKALDVCPMNTVLNHLASKLDRKFDHNGELAHSGKLNPELLQKLNQLPFYSIKGPRSLGIEWVEKNVFPLLSDNCPVPDLLQTFTHHAVYQLKNVIANTSKSGKILFTGGGTYNRYFMDLIKSEMNNEIVIPNEKLIEFKEALVFAFLGVLKIKGEINTLASVTGAIKDSIGGESHLP